MTFAVYAVCGVTLFVIGLRGFLVLPDLVRRVLAFNVMGSGTFLLFVSLADREPSAPDPVPQALVLTGIVVCVSVTALALALIRRHVQLHGEAVLPEEGENTQPAGRGGG